MTDKQLQRTSLEAVLEKRRLNQALTAKEFAVCAGVSYSTARRWFRLPGFPAFQGIIFWQDFVRWRARETGLDEIELSQRADDTAPSVSDMSVTLDRGGSLGRYRSRRFNRRGKPKDKEV